MKIYGADAIFPFSKAGYPRPNTITTIETNHGQIMGIPHPFPIHSAGGGEDTSDTAAQRLQIDRQGFYHFEGKEQPPPGMARFAFLNHRVADISVTGPGPGVGNPPNPYQSGMMYMETPAVQLNGLGGLADGQVQFQNLVDQNNYDASVDEYQP